MRKIQTQDVFKLARIIKAGNMKNALLETLGGEKTDAEFGLSALMVIMESCGDEKVEKMLYELLGSIIEEKPDEVKKMPINEMIEKVKEIAAENDLRNFFRIASKSI